MAWRVGMKVALRKEGLPPDYDSSDGELPRPGAVYHIREIVVGWNRRFPGAPYLRLVEIRNPTFLWDDDRDRSEVAFRAEFFRPLTDISIFEEIRDGKRRVADEPVDADALREMEHALADAGYMPADRYVAKWGKE